MKLSLKTTKIKLKPINKRNKSLKITKKYVSSKKFSFKKSLKPLGIKKMIGEKMFSTSINFKPLKKGDRLDDKVALVTGGGSGIGRETALLFASQGAKVVVADLNEEAAKGTADLIKEQGFGDALTIKTDVSDRKQVESMVKKTEDHFGKLNVMFNNAGIMHSKDDNAETTEDDVWDLTMNINVKGVFYGCKYGIPAMRRAGGGSIINTASFVALQGAATPQLAYTSSKGAVLAMSRELAILHAKENIRVNALCPGPLRTELLMKFLDTPEKKQRRMVHLPMGRFGEAREISQGALFLASDEASYVTGQDFLVDGGLTAAYVTAE